MKLFGKITALAAAMLLGAGATAVSAQDQLPQREHRAIWMTAFLGSNWPASPITEGNAASLKTILTNRLENFKDLNVNVLYYHVRSMCDAMYNSAYEPWSSSASGRRGTAPAFDPFEYLIQEAHKVGIEVYAWVNPYRYCGAVGGYGTANANDYENCHPDWLIRQDKEWILNPGIPEVRQRIADVCADIVTKYDVDGVVFDDYFYSNPTPLTLDKDLFNAYKAAGGTVTDQYEWRRRNVNAMVKLVNETIKGLKPWVVFGIAPPGTCSPPNCQSEYGFPGPTVGSDWQYQSIASEPMNWVKNGYLDFIGPQIYWPNMYNELQSWWINAANTFNRHLYTAISITDASVSQSEYAREVNYARSNNLANISGISYFQYANFVNNTENVTGKRKSFGENMRDLACPAKVRTPLRPWNNVQNPAMVTNVSVSGTKITWTAPATGDYRYTIYAIPDDVTNAQFSMQPEYLDGITTLTSYTIPTAKKTGYRWAVACYDRYGNEYSPVLAGGAPATVAPATLVYPANGGNATSIFNFSWTGPGNRFIVELARDSQFKDIVGWIETGEHTADATQLHTLVEGATYYWRVRTQALNAPEVVSATARFTSRPMAITAPTNDQTNLTVTPTITWDKAADGATYTVEISTNINMTDICHTANTQATQYTVPDYTLITGKKYYVRVTATLGGSSVVTNVVPFTTMNDTSYGAPVLLTPASSGVTLYANDCVEFERVSGLYGVELSIASSTSFPARTSFKQTITDFETKSNPLSEVKISSKYLEDGKTYYLRARGVYNITTSTSMQYTGYTATYTFVYCARGGAADVNGDGKVDISDAGMVLNVILGLDNNNGYCDVDGNGKVEISDAGVVINAILGI